MCRMRPPCRRLCACRRQTTLQPPPQKQGICSPAPATDVAPGRGRYPLPRATGVANFTANEGDEMPIRRPEGWEYAPVAINFREPSALSVLIFACSVVTASHSLPVPRKRTTH